MRALLCCLCLGWAFVACADPEETDSGMQPSPDSGVVPDSGLPRDTGTSIDTGIVDTGIDGGTPSDTGGDDTGALDTGADGGSPSDTGGEADATPADGGIATGPVTVIFDQPPGLPVPLPAAAIFHDSTGVLIASVTSTTGTLVQDVTSGAMLTIPSLTFNGKGPPAYELATIVGIEPGETYHVNVVRQDVYLGSVIFLVGDAYPGADHYTFQSGCSQNNSFNAAQPAPLDVYVSCLGTSTTTIDVLATAYDQASQPIAYRSATLVPIIAGSMVTMTEPWQTTFQDIDVNVTNPPAGSIAFQPYLGLTSRGLIYNSYTFESVDLSGGSGGTVSFHREIFGDGVAYQGYLRSATGEQSQLITRVASQGPVNLDLANDFLPYPSPVTVTPSPSVERPIISWTPPAIADLVVVQVSMLGPDVNWSFVLPPNASSFALPELPDELVDQRPVAGSDVQAGLFVVESDAIAGYAQVRAQAQTSLLGWFNFFELRAVPLGVRVRVAISAF